MARGVVSFGKTQQEAEDSVRREAPQLRILRSTRIDLSDFGPARQGRLSELAEKSWVVVVEWPEGHGPDPLPQQANPEQETEATYRLDMGRIFGGS